MAFTLSTGGASTPSTIAEDTTASGASPSLLLEDTTASAKDALFIVDADKLEIRDNAGAANSLLTIDLANNRLGVATAAPSVPLEVTGASQLNGAVTINEAGADVDLRVESDNHTHCFTVDASTSKVGIGSQSGLSSYTLGIQGNAGGEAQLYLNVTDYGQLISSASTSAGVYAFKIAAGGADATILDCAGGAVFNENGTATGDVRIEGDTATHLLFADASADKIGINNNAPASTVDITGNLRASGNVAIGNAADANYRVKITGPGTGYAALHITDTVEGVSINNSTDSAAAHSLYITNGAGVAMDVQGNGVVVFNEGGDADADHRIESDTNANMIFVDSSANMVGIGTGSPVYPLHVASPSVAGGTFYFVNTHSGEQCGLIANTHSGGGGLIIDAASGSGTIMRLRDYAQTEKMRFTGEGNLCFNTTDDADGVKVIAIGNAGTVPTTNATGGGLLYAEGGALKWRGSSGTVTTIANA